MLVNGIGLKTPEFCGFSRIGERLGTTLNEIMVRLNGQSLNALFEELADWNHQLEHVEGLKEALAAIEQAPDNVCDFNAAASAVAASETAPCSTEEAAP